MAAGKSKSRPRSPEKEDKAPQSASPTPGEPFVGEWNKLVSTTNWEKGRIICEWRDALTAEGAPATQYSDEAWAQLVGGVTSQHVGRLRRVFQQFGKTFETFEGLYWSHFQAALEWDDAEMWLEGAIQNDWSVSQMRGKRWETLGSPGKPPKVDDAAEASGLLDSPLDGAMAAPTPSAEPLAAKSVDVPAASTKEEPAATAKRKARDVEPDDDADAAARTAPAGKPGKRLSVEVDDLPDDLADAFEQFKLAIIAHRRDGWRETSPALVIECLDALRELTLADA